MWRALLMLAVVLPVLAADARPSRSKGGRVADEYRLVFLDGGPVVDVGRIVDSAGDMRTVVKRTFRLRIDGNGTARFVRVSAFVQGDGGRQRIRLDGMVLTSAPRLVSASTRVSCR